jgi:hypothetical protein
MKTITSAAVVLGGLMFLAGSALAADQLIQGRSLVVKDPTGGADVNKRNVLAIALEHGSSSTIVGNPTLSGSAGGAILKVFANGANSTSQTFNLPQGIASTGKPFWSAIGDKGYKYRDPKGDNGAVKTVLLKRSPAGTFIIKAIVAGKNGQVNVVPPNPGTDGYATLRIGGGGDRYCVKYGADGTVKNHGAQLFLVKKPVAEGCYGSPSQAFLDAPSSLLD